jgi:hypothetical protein
MQPICIPQNRIKILLNPLNYACNYSATGSLCAKTSVTCALIPILPATATSTPLSFYLPASPLLPAIYQRNFDRYNGAPVQGRYFEGSFMHLHTVHDIFQAETGFTAFNFILDMKANAVVSKV